MSGPFCSVHTHSSLCDGTNSLSEMAWAAYEAGAVSFGASGHSHTPAPVDEGCTLPLDLTVYREEVLRLREEFAGRMDVLLGIELDSRSDMAFSPADFDYWIGSVHHLYDGETGAYHSVDYTPDALVQGCRALCGGDFLTMAELYFKDVAQMAARRPTILGHIDLITKFNGDGRFFDGDHPRYRSAALEALHAADPAETLLEINTGAMSRGWRSAPYPALLLLKEWRAMGGRVILTADAHSAEAIVYGYDEAAELARTAGFRQTALLTASGITDSPL